MSGALFVPDISMVIIRVMIGVSSVVALLILQTSGNDKTVSRLG